MRKIAIFYIILASCLLSLTRAAPKPQSDKVDTNFDILANQNMDYNTVMGHFKDFFMYLPMMFSTVRESMSGFPKLAEGIKILTSTHDDNDDCKCKTETLQNSNEIEKSSNALR